MSNAAPKSTPAFFYVTSLFFAWGFATATLDPLVPTVRSIFTLSYSQSMLTQFAFFLSYGVFSLPAAILVARRGAAQSIVLALCCMVAGCLMMPLATRMQAYPLVLLALFVLGSGITLLQVAANPLAAGLGSPECSHLRLTLSQAFNSLGTVLAPLIGSMIMLRGGLFGGAGDQEANRAESLRHIDISFVSVAAVVALLALALWRVRHRLSTGALKPGNHLHSPFEAVTSRWAVAGAIGIFLYVGAEVSVGSVIINFLVRPEILNVTHEHAGQLLSLYWLGAMAGRFLGSLLMTRLPAAWLLTGAALAAVALCLTASQNDGGVAAISALSVGLCNSIMFPTIFTLTLDRSSAPPAATSGLLCMAIVGGAILPQLTGQLADMSGLNRAFLVPAGAYAGILLFAAAASRVRPAP